MEEVEETHKQVMARLLALKPGNGRRKTTRKERIATAFNAEPIKRRRRKDHVPCSVEGCDKFAHGRGYCSMHYQRFWRHGVTSSADAQKDIQS